jgi:N utilization substance protein B
MNPYERHQARRIIIQALYEKEISKNDNQAIITGFLLDNPKLKFDRSYFQVSFTEITNNIAELDSLYKDSIGRDIKELDVISKSILRLACYELKHNLDIPHKVVINEAIDLAKIFGAEDSYKFINGTLDKIHKKIRNF